MASKMLQYQVESCAVCLHYTNIALLQIQVQFYLKAGMFEREQKKTINIKEYMISMSSWQIAKNNN